MFSGFSIGVRLALSEYPGIKQLKNKTNYDDVYSGIVLTIIILFWYILGYFAIMFP